jgi:hypothetical protein
MECGYFAIGQPGSDSKRKEGSTQPGLPLLFVQSERAIHAARFPPVQLSTACRGSFSGDLSGDDGGVLADPQEDR